MRFGLLLGDAVRSPGGEACKWRRGTSSVFEAEAGVNALEFHL